LEDVRWDGVYTAETIGSYKPDARNYEYVVEKAREGWGFEKGELVMVAQSLDIDHMMSKRLGFRDGVWISREGSVLGGDRKTLEAEGKVRIGVEFGTLGEFAAWVEQQLGKRE
jgi:FMN phosphatase YigB (HAD superfamily)